MHDPWIEKLSDHIDGLLNDADARALAEHVADCAECRSIAAGLRAVVAAAHNAPVLEPRRDLWSGIAARIAESPATPAADTTSDAAQHATSGAARHAPSGAAAGATPAHDATVRSLSSMRTRAAARAARRYSLSTPQLAAAAVLLMALSGAGVWMIAARSAVPSVASGTIIQSAGDPVRSTSTVAVVAPTDYTQDVTTLERALEENRADLDPATVEIIQRSLESIDRAISDARSALAADPGNPYLHRQLDNTMQKKIDVLRRATGARRAQS